MYATNFSFADEMLSDYGCMICTIDSSSGVSTVSSGSDITFTPIKVPKNNTFNFIDSKYESVYTTTFQIGKCTNQENKYFDSNEESKIQRWLSRKEPHKFKVDQTEFYDSYFMGTFSVKKVGLTGQPIGYELTLTTNAPFAYKEYEEVSAILSGTNNTLTIYDTSDEIGISFPKMTLKMTESGDLTIENSMDNRILSLKGCQSGEEITFDSNNSIPTSNLRTSAQLGANGIFNFYYPRVFNTYEKQENIYTFSLDCEVTFSYTPFKKVGL